MTATLKQYEAVKFSRIYSLGAARGDLFVTNDDVAGPIDSSDEWIRQRTGIITRIHPVTNDPQPWGKKRLVDVLCPEHQTFAEAGSPTGARWTPFKATARDLLALVTAEPGITPKAALARIKHHWRGKNAHAQAVGRIRGGLIEGIRIELDTTRPRGEQTRLYPTTETA